MFVVNYDVPSGTVLDSFSLFGPNALAVLNFTITSAQPVQSYFAVQPSGPNSGKSVNRWLVVLFSTATSIYSGSGEERKFVRTVVVNAWASLVSEGEACFVKIRDVRYVSLQQI